MSHLYFYILKNLIPERIWDEKSLWLRVQRLWGWERLRAGREGGNREWDDWMASLTQWTWAWANSRRWWRTGKPGPAAIHEVTESQTQLNDWTTRVQFEHVWWKMNTHLTNITHTHKTHTHRLFPLSKNVCSCCFIESPPIQANNALILFID